VTVGNADKLAVVTHVQSVPASTVFASLRQGASPQSERPSTHPTYGETKVTDSGCIARGDNPLVGAGDGVALGVGDCDGTLIDAEGTDRVLAVGLGCEFPEAQPTRTRIENAATAPSLCRCAMTTSGSAGVEGAQSALDGTFEPDFQIRRQSTETCVGRTLSGRER
jgi:hypothetical protein